MNRPSQRRAPVMERLETRQVLSGIGASADKQYALELINLARTNPAAAADRLTSAISPDVAATLTHYRLDVGGLRAKIASVAAKPPVAYSDALDATAQGQSQDQAAMNRQTHEGADGRSYGQRLDAAGYSDRTSAGENSYAYADSVYQSMQAFLFDWGVPDNGHFRNIMQPDAGFGDGYSDVGIGITKTSAGGLGPMVITQNFAAEKGHKPQLLGVAYQDSDRDGFYTPGEGEGGVTIEATNLATGQTYSTRTWEAGGYQIPVDPGATYRVTETSDGKRLATRQVTIADVNAKVDFVRSAGAVAESPPVERVARGDSRQAVAPVEITMPKDQAPLPANSAPAATRPTWLGNWSRWRAISAA